VLSHEEQPRFDEITPASGPLKRLWLWLTTCAEDGCDRRPMHRGWCSEHAPRYDPGPDEYWGDEYWGDEYWGDDDGDLR
jgi:hypothetical protein